MREERIWGRKEFGGGKNLGHEIFNWMKTFGEERIWGMKDLIG